MIDAFIRIQNLNGDGGTTGPSVRISIAALPHIGGLIYLHPKTVKALLEKFLQKDREGDYRYDLSNYPNLIKRFRSVNDGKPFLSLEYFCVVDDLFFCADQDYEQTGENSPVEYVPTIVLRELETGCSRGEKEEMPVDDDLMQTLEESLANGVISF